ncbi:gephyrin-like molybdotransferase receptor GlpR [Gordonia sp. (in: high G+C Gram-positive bacteria)]|uniref:divisome protein SepX/GlpR n=1 Tax=Gordonia sp. (in: high G+C Gram-positive bacteria) TaxID=84139 RepID=UPI0039E605F8
MPNSVLWVCLVAIWLFVLVPMVIQGRPELRKSTPVAAATRVLKRGEEAVRRRRIGAGAHPHDPDYKPKKPISVAGGIDDLDELPLTTPLGEEPVAEETVLDDVEPVTVDPSRVPGKVPARKRPSARTVAARMRRVVSVTMSRPFTDADDEVTEVISVVDADDEVTEVISKVRDDDVIDAEVVDEGRGDKLARAFAKRTKKKGPRTLKADVVEVQSVEVIDVEITEEITDDNPKADDSPTEKIDKVDVPTAAKTEAKGAKAEADQPTADDSPTEKIDKVDGDEKLDEPATVTADKVDEEKAGKVEDKADVDEAEKTDEKVGAKAEAEKDESEDDAATLFDLDADEKAVDEKTADDEVAEVTTESDDKAEGKVEDDKAGPEPAAVPGKPLAGGLDLDASLDEADAALAADDTEVIEPIAEKKAPWDDEVDPNEMTQVLMTRPGRGGYDPEVDKERLDLKYKERQRVLLTLVGLTLLAVVAGAVFGMPGWIATGIVAFGLVAYLFFLRRAVKNETQIRQRRLARLERSRREQVARRRREFDEAPMRAAAPVPAPRPRLRRPSGMAVLEIDDEDPAFDHLPLYREPRMMDSGDDYRTAAVG